MPLTKGQIGQRCCQLHERDADQPVRVPPFNLVIFLIAVLQPVRKWHRLENTADGNTLSKRQIAQQTRRDREIVDHISNVVCRIIPLSTISLSDLFSQTEITRRLTTVHHPAYVPLHYVLLFPYGTSGWTYGLPLNHDADRDQRLDQAVEYTRCGS